MVLIGSQHVSRVSGFVDPKKLLQKTFVGKEESLESRGLTL